jgi:uncharacterized protein YutE (UPF0331/DUF86 family)
MDRRLIEEKLEALRQCVARVEAKRPTTTKILAADSDLQDILALNLTRAVQICVDIAAHIIADSNIPAPETMAQAFDALGELKIIESELAVRMKKAVGFRNIAVHSYQAIDWEIVFSICHQNLDDFKRFARAVANTLR